ncbi:MAG: hypothetical protein A2X86_09675 [Bdellovibrionales bacterium GWA2_49_15]|nr:MAG: hypothetical protein A2X86_09675 [Bdellovibrionales bacterium GWA2_49_15]HAZ13049.1 hypothetical protein [Bdellovibrionales bacterium]
MKVTYFIFSLAFCLVGLANSVHAKDRQIVNPEILKLVQDHNALENFRVYTSKKIKVHRETLSSSQDNVSGGVDRITKRKILIETVSSRVKGKIIEISKDSYDNTIAFVSFDRNCTTRVCAYGFGVRDQGSFLWYVPRRDMQNVQIKTRGQLFMREWQPKNEGGFAGHVYMGSQKGSRDPKFPNLEFKLSETESVIRDRIQNRGW